MIREETRVPDDPVEAMTRPGEVRTRAWLEAGAAGGAAPGAAARGGRGGPLGVRLGIVPAADEDALLDEAVRGRGRAGRGRSWSSARPS